MGGGGDSGTAAALAAISAKLEEIDHKLDQVIGKLDKLDQKISEQHIEIMNALESISFDVYLGLIGTCQSFSVSPSLHLLSTKSLTMQDLA